MKQLWIVACCTLVPGCHLRIFSWLDGSAPADPSQRTVHRVPIDVGNFTGLSDLTIDDMGHFWTVPERSPSLLRLRLVGDRPGLDDAPIPLEGVPPGHDTESLAWIAPGRFAVGTETQVKNRPSDTILWVSLDKGVAHVTGALTLPYGLWDMRADANDGIEGLCFTAGVLLASGETAGRTSAGERFAPVGRYDLTTHTWTPFRLLLTSRIGKISALACRTTPGDPQIEVMAIERHFGVSHLLHFFLPRQGPGSTLSPDVQLDFGKAIDAVPNFEGVEWSPQGDVFVLSDNDFGIVTGPTQVVVVPHDKARLP